MKKFILAFAMVFCLTLPMIAQQAEGENSTPIWDHGDNISNLDYNNVKIYKIYDQAENYVVLYEKRGIKVGQVNIPKQWIRSTDGNDPKLKMRPISEDIEPYMSVIYKDGSFYKVVLSLPSSRVNSIWGVAPNGLKVETDVDNFNIEY